MLFRSVSGSPGTRGYRDPRPHSPMDDEGQQVLGSKEGKMASKYSGAKKVRKPASTRRKEDKMASKYAGAKKV